LWQPLRRCGRFWLGRQHSKAWPLATACGGKGLTMLSPQPVCYNAFDGKDRLDNFHANISHISK
jgi:hypothetical protein